MNLPLNKRYRTKAFILVILTLVFGCNHSSEYDFVGIYEGDFTHGNFSKPIQIEIEKDSLDYKVYFTSPAQNAYEIPTSNVRRINDSIFFEVNSDYYSFRFRNKLFEDGTGLSACLAVDSVTL